MRKFWHSLFGHPWRLYPNSITKQWDLEICPCGEFSPATQQYFLTQSVDYERAYRLGRQAAVSATTVNTVAEMSFGQAEARYEEEMARVHPPMGKGG